MPLGPRKPLPLPHCLLSGSFRWPFLAHWTSRSQWWAFQGDSALPVFNKEIVLPLRVYKLSLFSYNPLALQIALSVNLLLSETLQGLKCNGEL